MKQARNISTLVAVVLFGALIVLNWSTLMANAPIDLLVAQVQAPLGIILLGFTTILVAVFMVAYLRSQIGAMLETRKLLKEMERVQGLADQADASRVENLHQLVMTEFRLLNERLSVNDRPAHLNHEAPLEGPRSLTELVTRTERH